MATRFTFVTSAALALALAACGADENEYEPTDVAAGEGADLNAVDPMAAGTPGAMGETATAAPQFVAAAASGGMYEVESSRLAQQQATNPEVKSFAEMMITDHTTANNELKTAASQANPPVTVPTNLDAKHQAMLDQLRNAGANFDKMYMQQQNQAHDETLNLLNGYKDNGDTQALKDWANKTLPVIQKHNQRAEQLAGSM